MKWLVITCFLLWARHGEGGALKCGTESEETPCPLENQEIEPQSIFPDTPTSTPEPLEVECLAGSEWESNCHSCRCSPDGAAECRRQSSCASSYTEPIHCKPNTTFERECNTCVCLENGRGLCTQRYCVKMPDTSTSTPEPLDVECLAGSEWESNCHSCRCTQEGTAECSRQSSCASDYTDPIRCKPNTTFERECNTCRCYESGVALCTLIHCVKMPVPARAPSKEDLPMGEDCAPGTEWKSGCNACVCTPDGLRLCSSLGCPEGQKAEPLLRCAPHSLWKKECNTCWCTSDGRAMCTKIGCIGIPSDMHFSDEENEPDSLEVVKPDILSKVPNVDENVLIEFKESDRTDDKNGPAIELDEYNLTKVSLKDLEDFLDNDVETPEKYSKIDDNLESLDVEGLESSFTEHETQDEINDILENQRESRETVEIDPLDVLKREELKEFETSYINHNILSVRLDADPKGVNNDLDELETLDAIDRNNPSTHHVIKRSVCKPNQDFQSECNTCKCSATGQSYACTQNECMDKDKQDLDKEVEVFMESEGVDHIERHSVCKPSATFFVGCNPCHCNADGTDFSCTNKPCPLPEDVEVFHELNAIKSAPKANVTKKKVCVENRMFIMNCNTCWCNEDGTSYMCTRRVCIPNLQDEPDVEEAKPEKLRVTKRECRPNEVFELECNMCRCDPDGKSFSCTRRACVDEDIKDVKNETQSRKVRAAPQEPPKACQPGQEFRMDCNKCLCDNEGQDFSCTRIDCNALNNNNNGGTRRKRDVSHKVPADCVPGSVFDQGCNVCRCTEDGGHAICTLKRCPNKEDNKVSTTESSFRCNPGEQFKQSCNDCSCSADGRSVFCTLFICDEDLTP